MDHDGPWNFAELSQDKLNYILRKLSEFESMTMHELFRGNPGKDYQVEGIPNKAAHERLEATRLADQTQISRLQLSGTERLYGFRDEHNVFHVVWWDPKHQIWPSRPMNT